MFFLIVLRIIGLKWLQTTPKMRCPYEQKWEVSAITILISTKYNNQDVTFDKVFARIMLIKATASPFSQTTQAYNYTTKDVMDPK